MQLADLSKSDLILLLDVADRSRTAMEHAAVTRILSDISVEIPTNGVIAGLLPEDISPRKLGEATFINVSCPAEWLGEYQRRNYFFCDPVKRQRLTGADCQIWSQTFSQPMLEAESRFVRHAREYGICDGITVGVNAGRDKRLSFFSFMGPVAEHRRHLIMLRYLAPHLHEALCRTSAGNASRPTENVSLSAREKEVLCWAMAGKTNWEISVILHISERTVKFHIGNTMDKLDASTRAHAVAIALARGIIHQ